MQITCSLDPTNTIVYKHTGTPHSQTKQSLLGTSFNIIAMICHSLPYLTPITSKPSFLATDSKWGAWSVSTPYFSPNWKIHMRGWQSLWQWYLNRSSGVIRYNPDHQLGSRETVLNLVQLDFIVKRHHINTNFSCKPTQGYSNNGQQISLFMLLFSLQPCFSKQKTLPFLPM